MPENTDTTTPEDPTFPWSLTPPALVKATELASEITPVPWLRLSVAPGGCSGLRYQIYFDNFITGRDISATVDGLNLVCDELSAPYLQGASVDFVDAIGLGSGFTIENPNAHGSCSCGDSFN